MCSEESASAKEVPHEPDFVWVPHTVRSLACRASLAAFADSDHTIVCCRWKVDLKIQTEPCVPVSFVRRPGLLKPCALVNTLPGQSPEKDSKLQIECSPLPHHAYRQGVVGPRALERPVTNGEDETIFRGLMYLTFIFQVFGPAESIANSQESQELYLARLCATCSPLLTNLTLSNRRGDHTSSSIGPQAAWSEDG